MRSEKENILPSVVANIIIIILAIPLLVLSITGYTSFSLSGRFVLDLVQNWEKKPIMDIAARGYSCPEGYSELILDYWPGTISGCDCTGCWSSRIPWNARNRLNRNYCSYNMTKGGCRDIRSYGKVPYNVWRGIGLCKKLSEKTYEEYFKDAISSSSSCRNGTKQCGSLDTTMNKICVKSEEDCPINKIAIQPAPPDDLNYTTIQLKDGVNLYTTKSALNSTVAVDFKISEGPVCLDPIQKNSKVDQYILDADYYNYKCTTSFNDSLYDTRYVIKDSLYKKRVYEDNGILPIVKSLPYYPAGLLEYSVELSIRPFLGWKYECLENSEFTINRLKSAYILLDGIFTYKLILMIFVIILFLLIGASLGVKLKIGGDHIVVENLLDVAFIILSIIVVIFSSICYNQFKGYSFHNFSCGDSITNSFVLAFGDAIDANRGYDLIITIIASFYIAVYPIILIYQKVVSGCHIYFFKKRDAIEINLQSYPSEYPTPPQPTIHTPNFTVEPEPTYPPLSAINQPLTQDPTNPNNMMYVSNPGEI